MVDPISDMLTRIRNAQAVGHKTVDFPFSKIKFELANILNNEKYLGAVSKKGKTTDKKIEVVLKYKDERCKKPVIQGLKRISMPGQRIYVPKKELNRISRERGMVILSTSQGIMTVSDAKRKNTGGEILFVIW
ncbi:MAG: 30S ribosomal protein S8 [bacterium]|nr:30S ribosomal protein S8 [bacterium]